MSNVLGIIGHNRSGSSVNKLLTAFGNDVVDLQLGTGYGLNLVGNNVEFAPFLDRVFLQDYDHTPVTYNGLTNKWTSEYVSRCLISKYLKPYKSRMYLGNCKFPSDGPLDLSGNAITFPSRVFFSDLYIGGNLAWGVEWGKNGKTYTNTNIFELAQPFTQDFVAAGIKVGDPLFITSGDTQLAKRPYSISKVENHRLYLKENIPIGATSLHFWVGSNWFDAETDDNDQITGLGKNSTYLLVEKLLSLWYYTGSQLKQVNDAPGTSSSRSIINKGGYMYDFHGSTPNISGIYRYDGVTKIKVSRAIDPYIQGMSTANYTSVVAWKEGDELRFYLGDLTNSNYNISMTNAVATLHTITGAWDVSPIADIVTCSTTWRTNNQEDTYCGTSDNQVLQMANGNSHNGTAIRLRTSYGPFYPSGTDIVNEMTRIQVIGRQTKGLKVKYKLWNFPNKIDDEFKGLGECTEDLTEFVLPTGKSNASGIEVLFDEDGILENDMLAEKISIFYKPLSRRRI